MEKQLTGVGSATLRGSGWMNPLLWTSRTLLSSLGRKRGLPPALAPPCSGQSFALRWRSPPDLLSLDFLTQSSVSSSQQALRPRKESPGLLAPCLCSCPLLTSWARTQTSGTVDPRPTLLSRSLIRIKCFMSLWKTPALFVRS